VNKIPGSARSGAAPASPIRLAVIGCGAIAEVYHLPALARHPDVIAHTVLVDPDLSRARSLAARFSVADVAQSYDAVADRIDAAILAVPPDLHSRIAIPLLARGIHVLCEKPLAVAPADAAAMVDEAARTGACLAVNNKRRTFPAFAAIKELLDAGTIGRCTTIEHTEGFRFGWPTVSGFYFASAGRPRGVLLDTGAHVLDTVCWWLGEKPNVVSCLTDSFGGPEGLVSIVLDGSTCRVALKISWVTQLSNTFRITGERGVIEGDIFDGQRFTLRLARAHRAEEIRASRHAPTDGDSAGLIIDNFLEAARGRATPLVSGAAVLPSIELIDECYHAASRLPMPWLERLPRTHGI
jgi:predicted dehydrogenase